MEGQHSMNFTNFWPENFSGRDNFEGPGVDKMILKWISIKYDGKAWIRLIWLKAGNSGRLVKMAIRLVKATMNFRVP
jgi:hypothetical protein